MLNSIKTSDGGEGRERKERTGNETLDNFEVECFQRFSEIVGILVVEGENELS
jgi:hypothetical protein